MTRRDNSGSLAGNNLVVEARTRSLVGSAPTLFERRKGGEWMVSRVGGRWRLEHGALLAWIWIDGEDDKLGRDRAEIDGAVDQRLGSLGGSRCRLSLQRGEDEIDRSF